MGIFDKYLIKEKDKEKKNIALGSNFGGGWGLSNLIKNQPQPKEEDVEEEPKPYKPIDFDLFLNAPSTEEISEKQDKILTLENDYETLNTTVNEDWKTIKELDKQLKDLEADYEIAPPQMQIKIETDYNGLRDTYNALIDKNNANATQLNKIKEEYDSIRPGFDKDITIYNKWAEAENRKPPEPKKIEPPDIGGIFTSEGIAQQLKGKTYRTGEKEQPTWGEVIKKSIKSGLGQYQASLVNVLRLVDMGITKLTDPIQNIIPIDDEKMKAFKEKYGENPTLTTTDMLTKIVEDSEKIATESGEQAESKQWLKKLVGTGLQTTPQVVGAVVLGAGMPLLGGLTKTLPNTEIINRVVQMIPFGLGAMGGSARNIEKEYEALGKEAPYYAMVIGGALTGVGEMATELPVFMGVARMLKGGGKALVNKGAKTLIEKYGKLGIEFVKNVGKEAWQEAQMQPIERAINKAMGLPQDMFKDLIKDMGTDAYGGMAMALVLGGLGGGIAGSAKVTQKTSQAIDNFINNKDDIKGTIRKILEYQGIIMEEPEVETKAYEVVPEKPNLENLKKELAGRMTEKRIFLEEIEKEIGEKIDIEKVEDIQTALDFVKKKAEPKAPGGIYKGEAYRAESGLLAKGKTAQEIVDFEAKELGNVDVKGKAEELAKELGIELKNVSERDIVWVANTLEKAQDYGEDAEKVEISKDNIILAEDGDGGFLILQNVDKYKKAPVLKEKVKVEEPETISGLSAPDENLLKKIDQGLPIDYKEEKKLGVNFSTVSKLLKRNIDKIINAKVKSIKADITGKAEAGLFGAKATAKWVGDFTRAFGKNPTDAQLKEIANEQLTKGYEEAGGKVAPDVEFTKLEEALKEIEEAKKPKDRTMDMFEEEGKIETGKTYKATVYRGTVEGKPPTDPGIYGKGTYFTTDKEVAETYGEVKASSVELRNPFVINTQEEADKFWNEVTRPARKKAIKEGKTPKQADEIAAVEARKYLEDLGYDGVVARGIVIEKDEVVVFKPKATAKELVAVEDKPERNKGVKKLQEETVKYRELLIKDRIAQLKEEGFKGTEKRYEIKDEDGYGTGKFVKTRSLNPTWYKDFYRVNKRKPNNKDLREIAIQQLLEGYDLEEEGIAVEKIPANKDFIYFNARNDILDSILKADIVDEPDIAKNEVVPVPKVAEKAPESIYQQELREIPLEEIGITDQSVAKKVKEYREQLKISVAPPIEIMEIKGGKYKYTVIDGQHRVEAAREAGKSTIQAWVTVVDKEGFPLFKTKPKAPTVISKTYEEGQKQTQGKEQNIRVNQLEAQLKTANREIKRLKGLLKTVKGNKEKRAQFKKALSEYIKANMPYSIRNKMLAQMKNVSGEKGLEKALEKVDEYVIDHYKREYIKKIRKELKGKRIAPKRLKSGVLKGRYIPVVQDRLDFIRANMDTSRATALVKIANLIADAQTGKAINIAEEVELLLTVGIKEQNLEELQNTLAQIKNLKTVGRTIRGLKEAEKRKRQAEDITEAAKVISGKEVEIDEETGMPIVDTAHLTFSKTKEMGKIRKAIDKIINWQFGWDNLMDKLSARDKDSKPYKSALSKIGDRVHTARIGSMINLEVDLNMIQEKFSEAFGVTKKRDILKATQELRKEIDLGEFKNAKGDKVHLVLTKEQILKKYMQLLDPTLEKTFDEGMLYTQEIKDAINNSVTEKEKKWVEGVKEVYEYMWQRVNPIFEELYGIHFPHNPNYSGVIRRDVDIDVPESTLFTQEAFRYASILNPSLKARTKTKQSLKYDEMTGSLMNYVMQMEHFVNWSKPLNDLRTVFGNKRIKSIIEQGYGKDILNKVDNFLEDMTRDGVDKAKIIASIDKIRFNFTRSILAKPHIALKQIPSVLAYTTEMPYDDFIKGISNFWKNPIKNYRYLIKNSPYAKERFGAGFERDIHGALQSNYSKVLAHSHKFSDIFMGMVRAGDKFAVMQGMWAKFYSETNGQTFNSGKEKAYQAMREAEITTQRTQPSFTVESLATGQRGGSFLKLFTMFQNQPNKYFRIIADNARNFKYGRGSRIKSASNIVMAWVVLPMLFQLVGDAGKFRLKHQIRAALLGVFNDILVFGSMIRGMYGWLIGEAYDVQASPVFATMREIEFVLAKIAKWADPEKDIDEEDIRKFTEHFAKAIGQLVGLPTPYAVQLSQAIDSKDYRQILFSEYILRGDKKPKSKKKYVKKYDDKYSKYLNKYKNKDKYSKYLKKYK